MELAEFLRHTQAEVREQDDSPYSEVGFTSVVMEHMAEIGMTSDPIPLHHQSTLGNARLKLSGYALSEEADRLDLFVSLYEGVDELTPVPDGETQKAAEQCLRFLARCVDGTLARKVDSSDEVHNFAHSIQAGYADLEHIQIYVLTDRVAKNKNFKAREIGGKHVGLEVMDIERLYRHWAEGKPQDEIVADLSDAPLPCVYIPGDVRAYECILTAIPGEVLRSLYEKFGSRLLEANVRSFLSATGKVNKGIKETLENSPHHFLAYNNGLVIVASDVNVRTRPDGSSALMWVKGLQIVNGGQTTASIYFSKRKNRNVELSKVWVPAKIIKLSTADSDDEAEALIADVSKFANSQNVVKQADLSANKPFHVEMEKLSQSVYCPDGVGRWFYERAAGSYNVWLAREGSTPAKRKALQAAVPSSRRVTKTDLAKYLMSWSNPVVVSQGSQKNFQAFMNEISENPALASLEPATYRSHIAKAILFKETSKLSRKSFKAFQINITVYTIALMAKFLGSRVDLEYIWKKQGISEALQKQLLVWASEVEAALYATAAGKMISEWAKKPECWKALLAREYSLPMNEIPEVRVSS